MVRVGLRSIDLEMVWDAVTDGEVGRAVEDSSGAGAGSLGAGRCENIRSNIARLPRKPSGPDNFHHNQ